MQKKLFFSILWILALCVSTSAYKSESFDLSAKISVDVLPFFQDFSDTDTIYNDTTIDIEIKDTICYGETYFGNGFSVNESGVFVRRVVGEGDTIYRLSLVVIEPITTIIDTVVCEGNAYLFGEDSLTIAGFYIDSLQAVRGCDSIVILSLSINNNSYTNISASICSGETYFFAGQELSTSGTFAETLNSVSGCDSIVVLTLDVNTTYDTIIYDTITAGHVYTNNGFNVDSAGTYTLRVPSLACCDSNITVHLTVIMPTMVSEIYDTIFCGETYQDSTFTEYLTGTYYDTLMTDTTLEYRVLHLVVLSQTEERNINLCEDEVYSYNNHTYSAPGTYIDTLYSINGCDSLITTININTNPTYFDTIVGKICEGRIYSNNGFSESVEGTYKQELQSVNGCDSTVILLLYTGEPTDSVIYDSICKGDTYDNNGFIEYIAGTYVHTYQSIYGCDSTLTLHLGYYPSFSDTIRAIIEEGEVYERYGFTESYDGTYTNYGLSVNGCDSNMILELIVKPIDHIVMPTGFTPMAETNNIYSVIADESRVRLILFQVFDRWGTKVFETTDISKGWDGKYKGKPSCQAVYAYRLLLENKRTHVTYEQAGEFMLYY